jgi:hypothetical protein
VDVRTAVFQDIGYSPPPIGGNQDQLRVLTGLGQLSRECHRVILDPDRLEGLTAWLRRTPGSGRQQNSCGIFGFDRAGSATVLAVAGLLLVLDARTGPLDRSPSRGSCAKLLHHINLQ